MQPADQLPVFFCGNLYPVITYVLFSDKPATDFIVFFKDNQSLFLTFIRPGNKFLQCFQLNHMQNLKQIFNC